MGWDVWGVGWTGIKGKPPSDGGGGREKKILIKKTKKVGQMLMVFR